MKRISSTYLILLVSFSLFTIMGCEKPEPIESAMKVSVDRSYYKTGENSLCLEYSLNFKVKNIWCFWYQGEKLLHKEQIQEFTFSDGINAHEISLDSLGVSLPASVYAKLEITTIGDEKLLFPTREIHIGYLDGSPFNQPNLMAYWPLEKNVDDYTYNGHHLESQGWYDFLEIPQTQKSGTYFDGTNFLFTNHKKTLNPRELSISAYIYIDELNDKDGGDLYTIVSKREFEGWGTSFDLRLAKRSKDGFEISVSWRFNETNGWLETNRRFPFKKAIHIVYVHNEDVVELWANGELISQIPSPGLLKNTNNLPICVGTRPGIRHSYKGIISDLAIWGSSLNKTMIQNIYNQYR